MHRNFCHVHYKETSLGPEGQSWDGAYFREIILQKHVIPFLRNPINVLDTNEVIFLHDKAPCMKANAILQKTLVQLSKIELKK